MKRVVLIAAVVSFATAGLAPAAFAVGATVCPGGVTGSIAGQPVDVTFECQRIEVPPAP